MTPEKHVESDMHRFRRTKISLFLLGEKTPCANDLSKFVKVAQKLCALGL